MKTELQTIKHINERLSNRERVCYVRYGDGDTVILQSNSIGHVVGGNNQSLVTYEIQDKVRDSLSVTAPDYMVSTLNRDPNLQYIQPLLPPVVWHATALHWAFIRDLKTYYEFHQQVRQRRNLYINSYTHPQLTQMLNLTQHIQIPPTNSTSVWEETLNRILNVPEQSYDQILLSAGFMTRVIFKDLYEQLPSKNLIDLGSVSDMYLVGTTFFNKNIRPRKHIKRHAGTIHKHILYLKRN